MTYKSESSGPFGSSDKSGASEILALVLFGLECSHKHSLRYEATPSKEATLNHRTGHDD